MKGKKVKIALIGSRDPVMILDGISVFTREVFSKINNSNLTFDSYVLSKRDFQRNYGPLNEIGIASFSFSYLGKLIYQFRLIRILVFRLSYDIIVVNGLSVIWILFILKMFGSSARLILVHHSAEFENQGLQLWKRLLAKYSLKFKYFADYNVAVSQYLQSRIGESHCIRNGAVSLTGLRREVQRKDILYAGRLKAEKGCYDLAGLLAELELSHPIKFLVPEATSKQIKKLRDINPNIELIIGQSRENVLETLYNSLLVIVPSWSEGFSLVTQEVLNSGRLPLQRNIPVLEEFGCPSEFYFDKDFGEKLSHILSNQNQIQCTSNYQRTLIDVSREWENFIMSVL